MLILVLDHDHNICLAELLIVEAGAVAMFEGVNQQCMTVVFINQLGDLLLPGVGVTHDNGDRLGF